MRAVRAARARRVHCDQCGAALPGLVGRFCGEACRAAYRVASGVDDVIRVCRVCGGGFIAARGERRRVACGLVCEEVLAPGVEAGAQAGNAGTLGTLSGATLAPLAPLALAPLAVGDSVNA
jgi:hypothetical protein